MDYKELIEQLRSAFPEDGYELERSVCDSAADAIEIMLGERDAAVKALRKFGCNSCKHIGASCDDAPCRDCCRLVGWKDSWEWRGEKGENHD